MLNMQFKSLQSSAERLAADTWGKLIATPFVYSANPFRQFDKTTNRCIKNADMNLSREDNAPRVLKYKFGSTQDYMSL